MPLPSLQDIVLRMKFIKEMRPEEISWLLDMPLSAVYDILKLWLNAVEHDKESMLPRGRPRLLDTSVRDSVIIPLLFYLPTLNTLLPSFFKPNYDNTSFRDDYLDEVRQDMERRRGVKLSDVTMWRTLRQVGFTLEKITMEVSVRTEALRAQYRLRMAENYSPEQLVFVDESAYNRQTYMKKEAWALKGLRAVRKACYINGKRYSILPALSLDGIVDCLILEGSFDEKHFTIFIRQLLKRLQPYPGKKSVIVMDSCPFHKTPEIRNLIEAKGMKIEYLPAYSPDLNPVEQALSLLKNQLRREGLIDCSDREDKYKHLYRTVFSMGQERAQSFFNYSGYL